MERLKRGLTFWVLAMIAMTLPGAAQTTVKKNLYRAQITVGVTGKGAATMLESASGYEYIVRTHAYPNQQVTKVSLWSDDWASNPSATEVVLCDNNGLSACTYTADGNIDIEGSINGTMLGLAQVSGAMFRNAIRNGTLKVYLDGGTLGVGTFERII